VRAEGKNVLEHVAELRAALSMSFGDPGETRAMVDRCAVARRCSPAIAIPDNIPTEDEGEQSKQREAEIAERLHQLEAGISRIERMAGDWTREARELLSELKDNVNPGSRTDVVSSEPPEQAEP
jgi:hypothetical protein